MEEAKVEVDASGLVVGRCWLWWLWWWKGFGSPDSDLSILQEPAPHKPLCSVWQRPAASSEFYRAPHSMGLQVIAGRNLLERLRSKATAG